MDWKIKEVQRLTIFIGQSQKLLAEGEIRQGLVPLREAGKIQEVRLIEIKYVGLQSCFVFLSYT